MARTSFVSARSSHWFVVLLVAFALVPLSAATPSVSPGGWIYLDTPVRHGVNCWIGETSSECSGTRWSSPGLGTVSSGTVIRGVFAPDLPVGLSLDNRAMAWVDYEFSVAGTTGIVPVEIAIKYDMDAALSGSAAYAANTLLSLDVTDISDPNGAAIGSLTLWDSNRQGDQGVTDVSGGGEDHIFAGQADKLDVQLPRGRTYRIRVTAQGSGSMLVLGDVFAMMQANVKYLRVQADEDEFERIGTHDAAMQTALANHDARIAALIAKHDADIKALLQDLKDAQAEIIRLLLTPQGLRQSVYCPGGAATCSFPLGKGGK